MTRLMLATGVAALAITAPAASAAQGGGHGRTAHAAAAQQGGGGEAKKAKRAKAKAQRAETRQQRAAARDRTAAKSRRAETRRLVADRTEARQRVERRADAQRGRDRAEARQRVERRADAQRRIDRREARADRREARVERREDALARANARQLGRNNNPVVTARQRELARVRDLNDRDIRIGAAAGYGVGGCPPGLAKKPVACMPPGQAAKLVNAPLAQARKLADLNRIPVRLQSLYPDTPNYYYTYGNGYAYRVNRTSNVISALLPLFGAGYTVGQSFPMSYPGYYMPSAYQPFYPTMANYDYRYANGYVYEIDPFTGRVVDVDPMLGYGYGYGQMMPVSYSAYNVPYQYRPLYYDTSNAYYRYAPGAIYQVDPTTSLITAVAALLTGGLNVGQPLPVGYSAYNVPYAYRTTYYDTPDAMYRYSNGYVYRVDPRTMLVTAIVASALT